MEYSLCRGHEGKNKDKDKESNPGLSYTASMLLELSWGETRNELGHLVGPYVVRTTFLDQLKIKP